MTFDPRAAFVRHPGCDVATPPEPVPDRPGRYVCTACGTEFAVDPPSDARAGTRESLRAVGPRRLVGLCVAWLVSAGLVTAQPQRSDITAIGRLDITAYSGVQTLPLVQRADITGVGAVSVPASLTYGSRALSIAADGISIWWGCAGAGVARLSLPALISFVQSASILEPCTKVANLGAINPTDPNAKIIGGTLAWQGRVVVSGYSSYDGAGTQSASHFAGATIATLAGPVRVGAEKPGLVAGYMGIIPPEWRTLLGGPALTGQCCISIISRSSHGPSVSVFDPAQVGVTTVASTMLVGYPQGRTNAVLGSYDTPGPGFSGATQMGGIAFPSGTRSLLFLGRHGTTYCYGEGTSNQALDRQPVPRQPGVIYCYDPTSADKGTHGYPYQWQVWAYDALDLLAVKQGTKQPWDVVPYGMWTLPGSHPRATVMGATWHEPTRTILLTEDTGGGAPVVHRFRVGASSPPPPPPVPQFIGAIRAQSTGTYGLRLTLEVPKAQTVPAVGAAVDVPLPAGVVVRGSVYARTTYANGNWRVTITLPSTSALTLAIQVPR